MKSRKTWTEKLRDNKELPKVAPIAGELSKRWGEGTMVIPAPLELDELMRKVPKGHVITINELRTALAKKHKVTMTCPTTTGIFAWIAAHAAQEQAASGKKRITPYWRTLKSGGELNSKYPGGLADLTRRLRAEGHEVVARGNRFFVKDFAKRLASI